MSMQKLCLLIIFTFVASIPQSSAWSKVVDIRVTDDYLRKNAEKIKIRSVARDGIVEFTVIRPLEEGHGTSGWLQVGKDRAKVCECSLRPLRDKKQVTYTFEVSLNYVMGSEFSLLETWVANVNGRPGPPAGDRYIFDLGEHYVQADPEKPTQKPLTSIQPDQLSTSSSKLLLQSGSYFVNAYSSRPDRFNSKRKDSKQRRVIVHGTDVRLLHTSRVTGKVTTLLATGTWSSWRTRVGESLHIRVAGLLSDEKRLYALTWRVSSFGRLPIAILNPEAENKSGLGLPPDGHYHLQVFWADDGSQIASIELQKSSIPPVESWGKGPLSLSENGVEVFGKAHRLQGKRLDGSLPEQRN